MLLPLDHVVRQHLGRGGTSYEKSATVFFRIVKIICKILTKLLSPLTFGGIVIKSKLLRLLELEPNSTTQTPATDTTNGPAHNNSTTNLPHRNARAQSTCQDVGMWQIFVRWLVFVGGVRSWCS